MNACVSSRKGHTGPVSVFADFVDHVPTRSGGSVWAFALEAIKPSPAAASASVRSIVCGSVCCCRANECGADTACAEREERFGVIERPNSPFSKSSSSLSA